MKRLSKLGLNLAALALVTGALINNPAAAQTSDNETPTSSPASKTWNYLWDNASSSWWRQRSSGGNLVVSGTSAVLGGQLTVQNAAYATGNSLGGLFSLPGAARVANGTGLVQAVTVTSAGGSVPALDVIFFNANPTLSAVTDKAAVVINAADISKIVGIVHMTDATLIGTTAPSIIQAGQQAMPYNVVGTAMYGVIITRTAFTPAATSDISIYVRLLQD